MQTETQILERAKALADGDRWPMAFVDGGAVSTETGWRVAARFHLSSLAQQLDVLEAEHARRSAIREQVNADADARSIVFDPGMVEEARAEARADLERHERERPKRTEALLHEIRDSLRALKR